MHGRTTTPKVDESGRRLGEALAAAHAKFPDQRLGQIILNAEDHLPGNPDVWYAEDNDLIQALYRLAGESEPTAEADAVPEETVGG